MKRVAVFAILLGCILGCRGSQSSYNLLAPYGSCRVPPPSTGNHTAPAGYYTPTTPPTVNMPAVQGTPTLGAPSAQVSPNGSTQVASGTWQPAGATAPDPGVQQATFSAPVISGADSSALKLNGMHVNDATQPVSPAEPARFAPPGQMTQLPQSTPASGTSTANGTVVSSAKASDTISPGMSNTTSSDSTLQWR